eukprot:scaffold687_cov288-Chaetoceros_neogracile.AAC.9
MRFSLIVSLFTAPLSIFASSSIITKHEFMSIMRDSKIQTSSPERKLRLQKSILAAAIPSKTRTNNNNNNVNNVNIDIDRSLYYDDQVNATDDSYANYGFNISAYSLKYAGCSSISTFSDDMAEDEDSTTVVETDQYAVFRFCPSDSCSDTTTYGCMDDYGEYMVPLYTWMTIVAEYREEEFERYCGYCDACYAANYYNSTDDGNNNNNNNRNLADDNDDGAAQADDYVANCGYENACKGYYDLCNNDDDKVDYSQFFGCKAYGASDDLTLYIGPHCAKDKSSIVIAPFQDDACSIYEGDTYDLATVTGLPFTSDALMEYYETDCIPCKESSLSFQNNADDNDDADTVTEVCETLYGYAAKCNRHIGGSSSSSYQSSQQEDNEYAVCSFIASVVTGTYDEYGYIYIDLLSFNAGNKYNQYSTIAIRRGTVTASQIVGLFIFSALIVYMAVSSVLLHKQIKEKAAFIENHAQPLGIDRQNSGIMLARSSTVDSTYKAPGTLA